MSAPGGSAARAFLERRGFDAGAVEHLGIGVVPNEFLHEKRADRGWLLGARDRTFRRRRRRPLGRTSVRRVALRARSNPQVVGPCRRYSNASARYLYLSGASRSGLPPYGLVEVLRLPATGRRELVLVEGLIDVYNLRANGLTNAAPVGGARVQPEALIRLGRLGFESVVLAFDNDEAGREGMSRAIERVTRSDKAPAVRVLEPCDAGRCQRP